MRVSFLTPAVLTPSGGVLAIAAFARALARRGHEVRLVHVDFAGLPPLEPADVARLVPDDDTLQHEIVPRYRGDLTGGDAVVCFDGRIPLHAGLPLTLLQGIGVLGWDVERDVLGAPCPRLCTSTWLTHVARRLGTPERQVLHLPYGIDHRHWHSSSRPDERPRRVALLHHPVITKGTGLGLQAVEAARVTLPDLEVTLFGTTRPERPLPAWARFVHAPTPDRLRDEIYGAHRAYLLPSPVEGFGLTGIEAQACGTPLVVTANGGSADYADDGVDALVARVGDIDTLASHLVSVLTDDDLALRLAVAGRRRARAFDWEISGAVLEAHLVAYLADPDAFRRPVPPIDADLAIGPTISRLLADFYEHRDQTDAVPSTAEVRG